MTSIEIILRENGPLISSKLAKRLSIKESIPFNTASQKVSRNRKIKKIKGFYTSNQSFCYLEEHEYNNDLYDDFIESLYENGRKYWYTINALKMHGGTLNKEFLECYTNYPIIPLKGHLPFNKIMQKFVQERILVYNDSYYSLAPIFNSNNITFIAHKTIEQIKINVLETFNSLAKNIGLISYNTGESFKEYGKFRWAFKGVSTISGLIQNGKSGFLLADIIIGTPIHEKDILFFIEKLNHIQSYKNALRLIPFLIVDNLDKKALGLLKNKGVIVGFINELFGNKYAEALNELINVLKNAGASLKKDPEKYLDLLAELRKYNQGLANNIRGTLFEFIVGHIHSVNCQSIEIGREIIENNGKHEIDVLSIYSDKVVFAECKAKKSQIDLDTINEWISIKIPAFKIWFNKQEVYKKKKLEFEYWSTSGFRYEALEKLENFSQSVNKFNISYFQANEIRERAISMENKKLKEALDNFFLKIDV